MVSSAGARCSNGVPRDAGSSPRPSAPCPCSVCPALVEVRDDGLEPRGIPIRQARPRLLRPPHGGRRRRLTPGGVVPAPSVAVHSLTMRTPGRGRTASSACKTTRLRGVLRTGSKGQLSMRHEGRLSPRLRGPACRLLVAPARPPREVAQRVRAESMARRAKDRLTLPASERVTRR